MSSVKPQKFVLLPELDYTGALPSPGSLGAGWAEHRTGQKVLGEYSDALVVNRGNPRAEELKSLPSPWARLLLFEQALLNERHPVHKQIVGEWRGLLACIGLANRLGINVKGEGIRLPSGDA